MPSLNLPGGWRGQTNWTGPVTTTTTSTPPPAFRFTLDSDFQTQVDQMRETLRRIANHRISVTEQAARPERNEHMNITTTTQMDALPTGSTVTVTKPAGDETWVRLTSGRWRRSDQARSNRGLASRFFTGSIEANAVRLAASGTGTPSETASDGLKPGDVLMFRDDALLYILLSKRRTNWSLLQMNNANAVSYIADRNETEFNDERWTKWTGPDSVAPHRYASYYARMMTVVEPMLSLAKVEVPEGLTSALSGWADQHTEEHELFSLLTANGVDMSVPSKATVSGTSTLDAEAIAEFIGVEAVTSHDPVVTPWSVEVDPVKVRRGCICDVPYAESIIDLDGFTRRLPAVRDEAIVVSVVCPQHPRRRPTA